MVSCRPHSTAAVERQAPPQSPICTRSSSRNNNQHHVAVLLLLCLVTVRCHAAASSSSSGPPHMAPWGCVVRTATATTAATATATSSAGSFRKRPWTTVALDLRGGADSSSSLSSSPRDRLADWLFPSRRRWSAYRRLLEDQNDSLERELLKVQDKLAQVRQHYRTLQDGQRQQQGQLLLTSSSSSRANARQLRELEAARKAELKTLQRRVQELTDDYQQLETLKLELERLLDLERAQVTELRQQLREAQKSNEDAKAQYQQALEELKQEWEAETARQVQAIRDVLTHQLERAQAETARALQANHELQLKLRQVQEQARLDIAAEQDRADKRVETEKRKMQKLVQALAQREKQLVVENLKAAQQTTSKSNTKVETVRGPVK